ncbi:MAG: SET domain-containing protein-lysine N-methyltransferase [Verrucomicrobia bacterium]|nr:SET domain-containing protein-lysine N-methyltransferase [Verrucomicrobiota bacterium]
MSSNGQNLVIGTSLIHGTGGFAARDFNPGDCVLEYIGERISKEESLLRCEAGNPFIFFLDEQWNLDGSVDWNPARFLNHSCAPNCNAELVEGRIWITARHAIRAGEELTFNYSYDLTEFREHPCRCGAPGCVGYMVAEEFFDIVRGR